VTSSEEYAKKLRTLTSDFAWIEDSVRRGGTCWICGNMDDPLGIQLHHVAGKNNSPITIPVCPHCHDKIRRKQAIWPELWSRQDNNDPQRRAAKLLGWAAIDELRVRDLRDMAHEFMREERSES
jgi:hypothetical protein